jgi:NAD(P)-dependent dehydrogenase (short-subunit alcohol dehydrogenase family)
MEMRGRVAVVTGGAVRVGKQITLELARAGANVVVNYNSSAQAAAETVAEAEAFGVQALAVQCDVADPEAVAHLAATVEEHFGGADCLVNSASYFGKTPFPSNDPAVFEEWHRVTRIMIDGPYYLANALAPIMVKRQQGAIVNIVDLSVFEPWRNFAAHAVGKSGLLAFTRQLALELAPTVRANAVALGNILPPDDWSEAQVAASARRILLGRWGTPNDAARAVRYLLEADFVTGEVLTVDGGERFWRHKPHTDDH